MAGEIATGSTGQARGINEVNRAVSQMEKVTHDVNDAAFRDF